MTLTERIDCLVQLRQILAAGVALRVIRANRELQSTEPIALAVLQRLLSTIFDREAAKLRSADPLSSRVLDLDIIE